MKEIHDNKSEKERMKEIHDNKKEEKQKERNTLQ